MDREYLQILRQTIEKNWDEEIACLGGMVAFPSINAPAVTEDEGRPEEKRMPFGREVQGVFSYVLDKGREMGLDVENIDNYGGHLEWPGFELDEKGEICGTAVETMGIIGHLDVVPAGEGWETDPFTLVREDGMLKGRGTQDDKGPVTAALYAIKALKDMGLTPRKNVRLILGLDEETNWDGLTRYLEKTDAPDFGFSPDGDFPVIYGEKGILTCGLAKKFSPGQDEGLQLRSITGGSAANMVAGSCRAILLAKDREEYRPIAARAASLREQGGVMISTRSAGKSLEVTVQGKPAHGAAPWNGVNAIAQMMAFLGEFNFSNDSVNEFLEFYNRCIGSETDGSSLGCSLTDEESGGTIVNVGLIEMDTKSAEITLCIRYPVTCRAEDIYTPMAAAAGRYDVGIVKKSDQLPLFLSRDNPMIKTMVSIYREHTGDEETEPLLIAGGTYARAFDNMVAFGGLFPGTPDRMHQAGEQLPEEDLKKMTLIYADAIYRLAVEPE